MEGYVVVFEPRDEVLSVLIPVMVMLVVVVKMNQDENESETDQMKADDVVKRKKKWIEDVKDSQCVQWDRCAVEEE